MADTQLPQTRGLPHNEQFGRCPKCNSVRGHDYALGGAFCMNPACYATAARQPETCEWCRGPHSVQDCPRLGGSGTPKAMADQSTEARLPPELLRETAIAWINGNAKSVFSKPNETERKIACFIGGAEISWDNATSALLDELTRLRAEVEAMRGEREKMVESRETFLADNAALRCRIEELEGTTLNEKGQAPKCPPISEIKGQPQPLNGEQANGG